MTKIMVDEGLGKTGTALQNIASGPNYGKEMLWRQRVRL